MDPLDRLITRKQLAAHFGFTSARSFSRWCKAVDFPEPDFVAGGSERWTARLVAGWQAVQVARTNAHKGAPTRHKGAHGEK